MTRSAIFSPLPLLLFFLSALVLAMTAFAGTPTHRTSPAVMSDDSVSGVGGFDANQNVTPGR